MDITAIMVVLIEAAVVLVVAAEVLVAVAPRGGGNEGDNTITRSS